VTPTQVAVPEFKDTELGPLPMDWQVVELQDISKNFFSGGTPSTKREDFWNGEIPWTTSAYIGEDLYLQHGAKNISKLGLANSSSKLVPKGNLLIGTRVGVGKVAINTLDIAISQDLTALILDQEKAISEFAAYVIRTELVQERFRAGGRGTTIKGIPRDDLKQIPIPLPPLPEQRRIAHVLNTIQRQIAAQAALIAATREVKRSLMQRLFTYGPGPEPAPTKETEIGEVPEHWGIGIANELCEKIVDCPHTTPKFHSAGILVVRNFNIKDGRLKLDPPSYTSEEEYWERVKRAVPQEGDILFSREAPIGEACLIPPDTKLSLGQRTMLLRVDPTKLNNAFLVYTLYSENIKQMMLSMATGVTAKHLNVGDVRRLKIPLPPLPEQNEIAHILTTADGKIAAEEQRQAALQELFKSMLHQLMTGQIRLQASLQTSEVFKTSE
jgi:type I restriction enzyme S subunit